MRKGDAPLDRLVSIDSYLRFAAFPTNHGGRGNRKHVETTNSLPLRHTRICWARWERKAQDGKDESVFQGYGYY
jgi:hypothetical protein